MVQFLIFFFVVFILLTLIYWGGMFYYKANISKELVRRAHPFVLETQDTRATLLVLGDSTGVGVGVTKSEDSVAGLLAKHLNSTYVENHSISGARVTDLKSQLLLLKLNHYNVTLLQIGGNDILRFKSAQKAKEALSPIVATLKEKSDKVILLSAGNVGAATIIPFPLRPFYHLLTLKYHKEFQKLADEFAIVYVNLYLPPSQDPFVKEPKVYLAEDGLHPSREGYQLWFERLSKKAL